MDAGEDLGVLDRCAARSYRLRLGGRGDFTIRGFRARTPQQTVLLLDQRAQRIRPPVPR